MSGDLKLGLEILFSGFVMVFAILAIFKVIMDLMALIMARLNKKKTSSDLNELELASIVAVIKSKMPELSEAKVSLTLVKEKPE